MMAKRRFETGEEVLEYLQAGNKVDGWNNVLAEMHFNRLRQSEVSRLFNRCVTTVSYNNQQELQAKIAEIEEQKGVYRLRIEVEYFTIKNREQ